MTYAVAMPDTHRNSCYLTRGFGDPPRTYDPEHANRYSTEALARRAITVAKKRTPFKDRQMKVVPHPIQ